MRWAWSLLLVAVSCSGQDPAGAPGDVGPWEVWSWVDMGGDAGSDATPGGVLDAGSMDAMGGGDSGMPTLTDSGPSTDTTPPPQDAGPPLDVVSTPPDIPAPVLDDADQDGVPDDADLFPNDPDLPGLAYGGVVYMQTADELWRMDVKTYQLTFIAFFQWPSDGSSHQMTDIAIDRYGVLYGVSFDALYTCHPKTGACHRVATLPDGYNALTFVPAGLLDADRDTLVAIGKGGEWTRLDRQGDQLVPTVLGTYGAIYGSSGDAYSIAGVGTYATVNKSGDGDDWLVAVHPATGHVTKEIGRLTGFTALFGLAGWTDRAFGFDETGAILVVDTKSGEVVNVIQTTPKEWWGAAVRTVISGP